MSQNLQGSLSTESKLVAQLSASEVINNSKILQYETIHNFPNRGGVGKLYISKEENAVYRWDENGSKFYCIGRDYLEIGTITGGEIDE